jgi:hypothetical protein
MPGASGSNREPRRGHIKPLAANLFLFKLHDINELQRQNLQKPPRNRVYRALRNVILAPAVGVSIRDFDQDRLMIGRGSGHVDRHLAARRYAVADPGPACYRALPEGPPCTILDRLDHSVVHVSWNDAKAYCRWARRRLPTEAEWEMAARGALEQALYSWGDELTPAGEHRCNIWQGSFSDHNTAEDGYIGTVPVHSFKPNGYGLPTMAGNVWEWCQDYFSPQYHRITASANPLQGQPAANRSLRGGSFLP